MATSLIVLAALAWLGVLFAIALAGERRAHWFERHWAPV